MQVFICNSLFVPLETGRFEKQLHFFYFNLKMQEIKYKSCILKAGYSNEMQ